MLMMLLLLLMLLPLLPLLKRSLSYYLLQSRLSNDFGSRHLTDGGYAVRERLYFRIEAGA
jgi:hypothetical protein